MQREPDRDQDAGTAPRPDESDYEDKGPIHTLIGTRIFVILILLVALLTIGVVGGIMALSVMDVTPAGGLR